MLPSTELHSTFTALNPHLKLKLKTAMEKLLKFKFHILFITIISLIILILLYIAPSFLNILAYFWPLLLSTAVFLTTVAVFAFTSPPSAQVSGEKAGEGILDYVAGAGPGLSESAVQSGFVEGSSKSEHM